LARSQVNQSILIVSIHGSSCFFFFADLMKVRKSGC
jgi:hypothetical protein